MTSYTPREGDTVNIRELTVGKTAVTGQPFVQYTPHGSIGPDALAELVAAGKVELIARAEPDWQYGDVGQHIETGALYRFLPDPFNDPQPWFLCNTPVHWYSRSELAGKLQRMRLVPEDEVPDPIVHSHRCLAGPKAHTWRCPFGSQCEYPVGAEIAVCTDHDQLPEVGDGGTNPGAGEPPPGEYIDGDGNVFSRPPLTIATEQRWQIAGAAGWRTWDEASYAAEGDLTRLFTVDELIPDPDDRKAVALIVGAADQMPASVTEPIAWGVAVNVLRVLRAKAAERTGGAS